jgi:phosphoadenosine phosphosulfate reductase family protein
MFKITWDNETGGVLLSAKVTKETLGISPRPVFFEELDLLELDKDGWSYPRVKEPIMWAINKQYWYRGNMLFEAKGANIYDAPTIVIAPGISPMELEPVDVEEMISRNSDLMFLLESEAIEFIRDTYSAYSGLNRAHESAKANQMDFEALAKEVEKKTKRKMAVVKEDCDSFDIVPLDTAKSKGKRVLLSTRIDRFIASFSGGKDSQVVLDLVTRAIPPTAFEVIYSDTGYELPSSLELYEEVKKYYGKKFPALKFTTTRNHESVLNYWDKIGTPSDTHRWCCSVMKTAPLYRSLKVEGNKQARVLTFDGVRAEESTRRSGYQRIGKGKHVFTFNAHPILLWNVTEIFLYMMTYDLPSNIAYRLGFSRVGCVICPFGSDWSDYLVTILYPNSRYQFLNKLESWVKESGIKDIDNYIKSRKWHISALGSPTIKNIDRVFVSMNNNETKIKVIADLKVFLEWYKVLGDYSISLSENKISGELKYNNSIITFNGLNNNNYIELTFKTNNKDFINNLIRVTHKAAYCVNCEVCEVECPTGALRVVPDVSIGAQCVHCLRCLNFHEKGCIVADCLRKISGNIKMETNLKIKGYKTFGLRDEWIDEYYSDPENFWSSTLLGSAMFDSFKAWTKDAGFLDSKNKTTSLGSLMQKIYHTDPNLFWEITWINLSYSSFIVNRFINYIKVGKTFDKKILIDEICTAETVSSLTTLNNAIGALLDLLKHSPLGEDFMQGEVLGKQRTRRSYEDLSLEAIAYSLYNYAQKNDTYEFRVSDLYR